MPEEKAKQYSPIPKKRRGNRRASNNSPFKDQLEPKIGVDLADTSSSPTPQDDDGYTRWLKEQKPPHWG